MSVLMKFSTKHPVLHLLLLPELGKLTGRINRWIKEAQPNVRGFCPPPIPNLPLLFRIFIFPTINIRVFV